MENQEIIEGNRLIAEFMGIAITEDWEAKMCYYESDWNQLMLVVERIENTVIDRAVYTVEISNSQCSIVWDRPEKQSSGLRYYREANSKLSATWKAVVAFIQWYNQNQLQKS